MRVLASYFLIFFFVVGLWSCDKAPSAQGSAGSGIAQAVPDDQKPVMTFDAPTHKFGTVTEGAEVSHEFEFTNTGKTDLLISNAVASCGCTVPEWPKEPIAPGEKGKIKATFNTDGKQGQQHKAITITANTKDKVEVFLEGMVNPKNQTNP